MHAFMGDVEYKFYLFFVLFFESKLCWNYPLKKLNYPLRKAAHASEYFVFTILILIALKNSGVKGNKKFIIALVTCFIYACTNEYHQTFVNERTGQFSDTLIDTFGGFISCLLYDLCDENK